MSRTYSRLVKTAEVFTGTISATGNQTAKTSAKLADFKSGFIAVTVTTVTGAGTVTGQGQSSSDAGPAGNNIGAWFVMSVVGFMPLIDYDVLGEWHETDSRHHERRTDVVPRR